MLVNTLTLKEVGTVLNIKTYSKIIKIVDKFHLKTIQISNRNRLISEGALAEWMVEQKLFQTTPEALEHIQKTVNPLRKIREDRAKINAARKSRTMRERMSKGKTKTAPINPSSHKTEKPSKAEESKT